jgi:hypothetical protein
MYSPPFKVPESISDEREIIAGSVLLLQPEVNLALLVCAGTFPSL